MLLKRVSIAVVAVIVAVCAAHAQSANDFRGPTELPPAGFTGQQFVDSRGCVFLKAGLSGRVNWVPRVSRDRRQLCGYPPTFAAQKIDVVENTAPVAPKVPERVQAAPVMKQAAARPVRQEPAAAPAPAAKKAVAGKGTAGKGTARIGCYRDAPVAERFALQGGGTIVLCTRGDGDLDHARPPVLLGGKAAVAASGFVERKASPPAVVPKGYRATWQDDRLNPHRGKGTAEGQMAQDRIWTRQVPARLVADTPARGQVKTRPVRLSTKSATETASARLYVQVGSFGQPANAEGAAARLAGLGLPVAQARAAKGGLRVIMAGPFGTEGEARAALAASRSAGFSDAFIR